MPDQREDLHAIRQATGNLPPEPTPAEQQEKAQLQDEVRDLTNQLAEAERAQAGTPGPMIGGAGTLYLNGEKVADVTDIRMAAPTKPFSIDCDCSSPSHLPGPHCPVQDRYDPDWEPADWYPERNVAGSTPYRNLGGCWYCGRKIHALNGMCATCDKDRPWTRPNPFIVTRLVETIHRANPNWWREYIGGPDACVACGATDTTGPIEHTAECPVDHLLGLLGNAT